MSDFIDIKDLFLRTIVGINPEEREQKQDVLINLRLWTDLSAAGCRDQIDETLNYRTVCKQVIQAVENSQFFLVERLAQEVADVCLKHDRVDRVRVSVEKPGALRFARSVGVVIERGRHDS